MLDWLDWKAVKFSAQAREILAHLLGIDDADPLARFEVEGSVARLSFYRHWKLVRLSSRFRDGDSETALEDAHALWRTDRPAVLLDGDSDVVHTTNEDESLHLDDAHVPDYIRWFCFAVRAERGEPFIPSNKCPKVAASDKAAAKDAKALTPKGRGTDGAALVEGTVIFSKTSFTSVFSVPPNGQIVMVDDDPLTDDFPRGLHAGRRARARDGAPDAPLAGARGSTDPTDAGSRRAPDRTQGGVDAQARDWSQAAWSQAE